VVVELRNDIIIRGVLDSADDFMKSVDGCMSDFTLVCSTQVCLGVFSSAVKGAVGIFMS
jgi:hypothetical protein